MNMHQVILLAVLLLSCVALAQDISCALCGDLCANKKTTTLRVQCYKGCLKKNPGQLLVFCPACTALDNADCKTCMTTEAATAAATSPCPTGSPSVKATKSPVTAAPHTATCSDLVHALCSTSPNCFSFADGSASRASCVSACVSSDPTSALYAACPQFRSHSPSVQATAAPQVSSSAAPHSTSSCSQLIGQSCQCSGFADNSPQRWSCYVQCVAANATLTAACPSVTYAPSSAGRIRV